MDQSAILMSTDEGREIWAVSPPGPTDIIAIDDDEYFVGSTIPEIFERLPLQVNARVFCFTDPDHALMLIEQLGESANPQLYLVDMMFSSIRRGPEIIDQIRRVNWRAAIVGYSAYGGQDAAARFPVATDAMLANQAGADEWFNKSNLLDEDYQIDLHLFFGCVVRALERRQTWVRELERRISEVREEVYNWGEALLTDERVRTGQLSASDVGNRLAGLSSILAPFDKISDGRDASDSRQSPALLERSLAPPNSPAEDALPDAFLKSWANLERKLEGSGDVLVASRLAAADDLSAIVYGQLDDAVRTIGYSRLTEFLRSTIIKWGKMSRSELVRSFAHISRQWAEARRIDADPIDRSSILALITFLKAAQGQAAAELGYDYEAYDYLSTAASEASLFDVAQVREFARKGLLALAARGSSSH